MPLFRAGSLSMRLTHIFRVTTSLNYKSPFEPHWVVRFVNNAKICCSLKGTPTAGTPWPRTPSSATIRSCCTQLSYSPKWRRTSRPTGGSDTHGLGGRALARRHSSVPREDSSSVPGPRSTVRETGCSSSIWSRIRTASLSKCGQRHACKYRVVTQLKPLHWTYQEK